MTSQYGAYELRAGLVRLYARMCMHTPSRPSAHMHARTHARASMHTYKYAILTAFPQEQWFRERSSAFRLSCSLLLSYRVLIV